MGGACVAGACVPLPAGTLATGQLAPIFVTADGTNVYWMTVGALERVGTAKNTSLLTFGSQLLMCAASGCNNRPTVLADFGVATYDGGAGGAPSIAVDATNLYFTAERAVLACAIGGCGCSPTIIAQALDQPWGVVVAADRLFWGVSTNGSIALGQVETCATTGCSGAPLLIGGAQDPTSIAADQNDVYWTNRLTTEGGALLRCSVGGCNGAPTTLWTGGMPFVVTSDAANLYWTASNGSVMQCAKSDCPGTAFELASHRTIPTGIAVDGASVYWREDNIYKCAIGGCNGAPTQVATASMPVGVPGDLAIDATRVYWFDVGSLPTDGRIMWASK
jgi:hypothetical protein